MEIDLDDLWKTRRFDTTLILLYNDNLCLVESKEITSKQYLDNVRV